MGVLVGVSILVGACNFGGGGGDSGDSGQPTAKWFVEKGPPSNSQGANGDLYLDTDNAVLYVKTSGQWVAAASLRGPSGSGWLFGAGVPASTLGSDGDLYLDTSTSMTYRKLSGTWSALFALKGDTGATGAQGPQGEAGPPGTQWYSGTAVPTPTVPSTARPGDYYLQTSTAMVYKKDAGGNWSSILVMACSSASFLYTPHMFFNYDYGSVYFNAIAYGNGTYIAVGSEGSIIRSTDGVYWKLVESTANTSKIVKGFDLDPNPSGNISDELVDVAFGNNIFIAVGEAGAYASWDNGLTWDKLDQLSGSLTRATFVNGKFYLSGSSSSIFSSSDANTWIELNSWGYDLTNIAYGNGKYLAFSHLENLNGICSSLNGVDWTFTDKASTSGLDGAGHIYSVVFGNGVFIATGSQVWGEEEEFATIWISSDGLQWTTVDLPVIDAAFYDVAFGNGFAAIGFDGNNNYLLSSSNGISWNIQSIPALQNPTYSSYARFSSIAPCLPGSFAIAVGAYYY